MSNISSTFRYIDIKYLSDTCPGNPAFVKNMLEAFQKGSVYNLGKMISSFQSGNLEELKKVAHSIKPTGAYIGASAYTDAIRKLEDAVITKNEFEISIQLNLLTNLTEAILFEIDSYIKSQE